MKICKMSQLIWDIYKHKSFYQKNLEIIIFEKTLQNLRVIEYIVQQFELRKTFFEVPSSPPIFQLKRSTKLQNKASFKIFRYGDFTVTKVKSRLFAVAWCLIGLIMTSLIVGAIVTALTTVNGSSQFKIYGSQVSSLMTRLNYFCVKKVSRFK